jgi:hypothetical protein
MPNWPAFQSQDGSRCACCGGVGHSAQQCPSTASNINATSSASHSLGFSNASKSSRGGKSRRASAGHAINAPASNALSRNVAESCSRQALTSRSSAKGISTSSGVPVEARIQNLNLASGAHDTGASDRTRALAEDHGRNIRVSTRRDSSNELPFSTSTTNNARAAVPGLLVRKPFLKADPLDVDRLDDIRWPAQQPTDSVVHSESGVLPSGVLREGTQLGKRASGHAPTIANANSNSSRSQRGSSNIRSGVADIPGRGEAKSTPPESEVLISRTFGLVDEGGSLKSRYSVRSPFLHSPLP